MDIRHAPKVVVIGGGTGSSVVLQGLKHYTDHITAIVSMFDSGGSSGILRQEFGYPPLGDLRQCLLALSEADETTDPLRAVMQFRFDPKSSLQGHSLGNLLMAALTTFRSNVEGAIEEMSRILRITGQVVPVTLDKADLCAELENGEKVVGESSIDLRARNHPRIHHVYLDQPAAANPRAVKAILEADAVVLGPGDLYTSIIPNLLARGIPEALARTKATRIYVCNLMTKLGETDGYSSGDFVRELMVYLAGPHLDWAVVNAQPIPEMVRTRYAREGAYPVAVDLERVHPNIAWFFGSALALVSDAKSMRHSQDALAATLINVIGQGRAATEPDRRFQSLVPEVGLRVPGPDVALA